MIRPVNSLLLVFGILAAASAQACDATAPRCKELNALVDQLAYRPQIRRVQAQCEENAKAWKPDSLPAGKRTMLKGLTKAAPNWSATFTAYEMYVSEACGGPEIESLILEGYRIAWDARAPGEKLAQLVTLVRQAGRDAVANEALMVSAQVNNVIGRLLDGMSRTALRNYEARLLAVAMGATSETVGAACGAATVDAEDRVPQRERLVWPPPKS